MTVEPKTLHFDRPVLLAGPADVDFDLLGELARRGFPVIAADGGANRLLDKGIVPKAIIGDLDSLDVSRELDSQIVLVQLAEQDSTDFEKCLYSVEAPLFVAFGFTGKRFDHSLATLHGMAKYHGSKNVLLLGGEDISFVHSGNFITSIAPGQTISIFPLGPISFSHSEGLTFALDGLKFEIGGNIGTSNLSNSEEVRIFPSRDYQNTPYVISLPNNTLERLLKPHLS